MPKFRKKPVVIEAELFTEATKDRCYNFVTCNHYADWVFVGEDEQPALRIQTLEGEMTAHLGDWIIKGVKGEFYPCKPDIFDATYERVAAWQPIETAPKDGSQIILWWPYWRNFPIVGFYDVGEKRWSNAVAITDHGDLPTHWMPLPNPPSGKEIK